MGLVHDNESYAANQVRKGLRFERPTHKSISADATLTVGDAQILYLDATVAGFTVTLPATPYEGLEFAFSENAGSANPVVIDGNGKTINLVASLTMNAAFRQRVLRYDGVQWIVIGGVG